MPPLTIGAINWDCSLPSSTFFGHHATKSLSPRRFRHATPYYADILGEDRIDYHVRTAEEYDRELRYAIGAGIDYFAYCWYGDDPGKDGDPSGADLAARVDGKVHELTYARKMHARSALREKIRMCAVIVMCHPWTEREWRDFANATKESCYQTVDGRPLVYLFGGYDKDYISQLRRVFADNGAQDPYVAFLNNGMDNSGGDYSLADAVSSYAGRGEGCATYAEHVDRMVAANEDRKKYGLTVIPHFAIGWDPSPRIVNPVPWCRYPDIPYAPTPNGAELLDGAHRLGDWIRANRAVTDTGHILSFAWNEFEEGAWICPTIAADGGVDTRRTEAFAQVVKYWRSLDVPT